MSGYLVALAYTPPTALICLCCKRMMHCLLQAFCITITLSARTPIFCHLTWKAYSFAITLQAKLVTAKEEYTCCQNEDAISCCYTSCLLSWGHLSDLQLKCMSEIASNLKISRYNSKSTTCEAVSAEGNLIPVRPNVQRRAEVPVVKVRPPRTHAQPLLPFVPVTDDEVCCASVWYAALLWMLRA